MQTSRSSRRFRVVFCFSKVPCRFLPELTLVLGPPIPSWGVEQGFDADFTGHTAAVRTAMQLKITKKRYDEITWESKEKHSEEHGI